MVLPRRLRILSLSNVRTNCSLLFKPEDQGLTSINPEHLNPEATPYILLVAQWYTFALFGGSGSLIK